MHYSTPSLLIPAGQNAYCQGIRTDKTRTGYILRNILILIASGIKL